MLASESKTKSGIVLRAISLGSLEILRQLANPLSTAEVSAHARHIPFDRGQRSIIYCGE